MKMKVLAKPTYNEETNRRETPLIIECPCGEEVHCWDFTNTCDCGRDFNSSGSLLADRSQWGLETGEHWSDCY